MSGLELGQRQEGLGWAAVSAGLGGPGWVPGINPGKGPPTGVNLVALVHPKAPGELSGLRLDQECWGFVTQI